MRGNGNLGDPGALTRRRQRGALPCPAEPLCLCSATIASLGSVKLNTFSDETHDYKHFREKTDECHTVDKNYSKGWHGVATPWLRQLVCGGR